MAKKRPKLVFLKSISDLSCPFCPLQASDLRKCRFEQMPNLPNMTLKPFPEFLLSTYILGTK
jgi:hypothetical protein